MALQIIARGRVEKAKFAGPGYYLIRGNGSGVVYVLGDWARDYLGQTITISYEEPEEESVGLMEKFAGSMRRALAPA